MMSTSDLFDPLTPVIGNYYAPRAYVQSELESGLLSSRRGDRLLAIPQSLLQGIYSGLDYETGMAARLVLKHCGRMWGKEFFRRFAAELEECYGCSLADLEMGLFIQNLQQAWKTHGWGILTLNWLHKDQGVLIIEIAHSPFSAMVPPPVTRPMGFLEAGLLATWFSQITGRDLGCVQTQSEQMGAEANLFIVTTTERLKDVETWVDEGMTHPQVLEKILTGAAGI